MRFFVIVTLLLVEVQYNFIHLGDWRVCPFAILMGLGGILALLQDFNEAKSE